MDRRASLDALRRCAAELGLGVLERRLQLLQRIAELEEKLKHYPAGERSEAIRARLGLSRPTYYRLRAQALGAVTLIESRKSETGV